MATRPCHVLYTPSFSYTLPSQKIRCCRAKTDLRTVSQNYPKPTVRSLEFSYLSFCSSKGGTYYYGYHERYRSSSIRPFCFPHDHIHCIKFGSPINMIVALLLKATHPGLSCRRHMHWSICMHWSCACIGVYACIEAAYGEEQSPRMV
jgi:hypothetical protein